MPERFLALMARRKCFDMIDSWKNREVFEKQLEANLKRLVNHSQHWLDFAKCLSIVKPESLCDIGSGSGVYSQLCTGMTYIGLDYAQEAVDVATEHWKLNCFHQMDLFELVKDFTDEFDCLHFGGLLDVLPNADDALKFILELEHKCIILGRVQLTTEPSYYRTYKAYDLIETGMFYHNQYKFVEMIRDYGYEYDVFHNTWLLRKNHSK